MARRQIVEFVDDMDGSEALPEPVKFSIDGVAYEIDLSESNQDKLRAALEPFRSKARRVGRVAGGGAGHRPTILSGSGARTSGDRNREIREWAGRKGIPVSDRGRIKQEIVDQYNAEIVGRFNAAPSQEPAPVVQPELAAAKAAVPPAQFQPGPATPTNGSTPAVEPAAKPAKRGGRRTAATT